MYEQLIGLKLADAQQQLELKLRDERTQVVVLETAPPFTSKHRRPIFGDLRVLRVRPVEENTLELLVARELLAEEKVERD